MDYLQTLEFRMAALQRKIQLLQDLRFFVETSSPEELAAFGDELRSVLTSSGVSVGSALAAILGAESAGKAPRGAGPAAPLTAGPSAAASAAAPPGGERARAPEASEGTPSPGARSAETAAGGSAAASSTVTAGGGGAAAEALALIESAMKAIPAGSFVMGSETVDAEMPPHKVALSAFRLCDHLVTNREYALFVAANPEWSKDRADPELRDESYLSEWGDTGFPEGKEEHPVAFVSFFAAEAMARWLGKRLPTEAEWECAARGGLVGKKYPNGDQMNDTLANLAKQRRGTTAVRSYQPNAFGLYDMAGNLFEWTSDWYGPYSPAEARDPAGPGEGEYKVVRGGSWMSGAGALRVSARVDMEPRICGQVGIRLADGG